MRPQPQYQTHKVTAAYTAGRQTMPYLKAVRWANQDALEVAGRNTRNIAAATVMRTARARVSGRTRTRTPPFNTRYIPSTYFPSRRAGRQKEQFVQRGVDDLDA